MIVVTGGAGFIGSNIIAKLNDLGCYKIAICDRLRSTGKWKNLGKRQFEEIISPEYLLDWLNTRTDVEAVIHMGAISSTTAVDGDEIVATNIIMSTRILDYCTSHGVAFFYASSAAVYGDGERGFVDEIDPTKLMKLRPLNLYGWSKWQFDSIVARRVANGERMPPRWAGFRFFNVFGPNEDHKGDMKSVVAKLLPIIQQGKAVSLFRSHRENIANGDQMRDFIYVKDVVAVVLWALDCKECSTIYNVGTGQARSFKDLAASVFLSLDRDVQIEYIDMPKPIRDKYQYHTEANLQKLRRAGYDAPFERLEDSVRDYVTKYLIQDDKYC